MLSRPRGAAQITGAAFVLIAVLLTVGSIGYGVANHDPSAAPAESDTPARPGADSDFVYAEGTQLMLHGEPFYYAGSNAYTLMLEAPAGVDMHMKTAVEMDMKVLRAWAFYDYGTPDGKLVVEGNQRNIYFQYWDEELGRPVVNEGENGLQRLDYVLYSAAQHDIKLVLPLVNNWTAFGGVDQYVRWAGGIWHDDFFRDETMKGWYKDWVSTLLNRVNPLTGIAYKDDPTILAWEIGNELRCSESGPYLSSPVCNGRLIYEWSAEMSDYVRSIDSNHLIGFGGEGFMCSRPGGPSTLFNCAESADPVQLLELPNIDIHGIHVYPNHWEPEDPTDDWVDWGAWWIEEHGRIAEEANKPYYIGEYGWTDQTTRMGVFDRWLQAFYDAGGDGSHFWIMQPAASIGQPPDYVGFTQRCPGPACDLVANWSRVVGMGASWSDFAPIAESDQAVVATGGTVSVDVLANDKVFAPAMWDRASIDLDPETPGVQTEMVTKRGIVRVVDGVVTFEHDPEATGTQRVDYVVSDSQGRASSVATVAFFLETAPAQ
jgi:mannan endo-1,4-beta-mannosidase